jgi:hypothetical protein
LVSVPALRFSVRIMLIFIHETFFLIHACCHHDGFAPLMRREADWPAAKGWSCIV